MAVFKCKMCGGDLEIAEGVTIAECEYCGAKQTVPKATDENLQNIFNRANTLRMKSEFDKAEKLYEKIIQADSTQSEAYWGLILCKYGIEYVDDPATFKKVPTCHRASYDSIIADEDYKSALDNADISQRSVYEEQAKEIDRIQKDILALAQKEENYDVFICYKETDASGSRTQDSVIANDIFYQLTKEGFKVFYAAITLEGKLGSAYEPIIFAALNSAKVMLAIGTKPEYFNAVWVKNEWSRYLKIIKNDRSKLLIPCYRDMDAYELPDEFAHLQAQDMSKIGFINDIVRGIQKVIPKDEPKKVAEESTVYTPASANIAPLLKRVFMFLEDGDWSSANEYCEKVLDINPECAEAYLGKLMVKLKICHDSELAVCDKPYSDMPDYKKTFKFAGTELRNKLTFWREEREKREHQRQIELARISADNAQELDKIRNKLPIFKNCIKFGYKTVYGIKHNGTVVATGENSLEQCNVQSWRDIVDIATGIGLAVGLKRDGKVVAAGTNFEGECNVNYWRNISKVYIDDRSFGKKCTIGLQNDGNFVLTGTGTKSDILKRWSNMSDIYYFGDYRDYSILGINTNGEIKTNGIIDRLSSWYNIDRVHVFYSVLIGIRKDGTVVASGANAHGACNVQGWTDIISVSVNPNYYYTVGLKKDGTVVITDYNGTDAVSGLNKWKDIVSICCPTSSCVVGLQRDGRVVAVGKGSIVSEVQDWQDIVAIYQQRSEIIGLRKDGTVVVTRDYSTGSLNVKSWKNVVAIYTGTEITVGLRNDGTVIAACDSSYGQCSVGGWKLFDSLAAFEKKVKEEEAEQAKQAALLAAKLKEEEAERAKKASRRVAGLCQYCGGTFKKSFLQYKCMTCGHKKDY